MGSRVVVISRGDVFWLTFRGQGSEPDGRRPAVVVQHDRFNDSLLATTVVAAITSNLRLGAMPGNVRLARGEANLPRACVVNVTQLSTIDRARLTERVGRIGAANRREVAAGLALVLADDPAAG